MERRTAFVTGATGFLGLNLVERLAAEGWHVVAFHRATSETTPLRRFHAVCRSGKLTDPASVAIAMPEDVDAVFHVAGDTNVWGRNNDAQTVTNVEGTRAVVQAAIDRGAKRFIHTSSISAYGFHDRRVDETSEKLGAKSWVNYVRTKALAEEEVRDGVTRGLDAVIMNPGHLVGRYDRRNWIRLFMMVATGSLPAVPPGRGSFAHASAVAAAHVAAVDHGMIGENYLLGGADATFVEFVREIGHAIGRKTPDRATPAWALRIMARVLAIATVMTGREPRITPEAVELVCHDMLCDSAKAKRHLGYRPETLARMVADCHNWLMEQGALPGHPVTE